MSSYVYLDTETTGLSAKTGARIVEVAIVDDSGRPLFDSLINPGIPIPWGASSIHGISDSMVRKQPRFEDVVNEILRIVSGREVVIYNAAFDVEFFPNRLKNATRVHCAMKAYSASIGQTRWVKLVDAASRVGHTWDGKAHRALADAQACRSVWRWLGHTKGVENASSVDLIPTKLPPKIKATTFSVERQETLESEREQRRHIRSIVEEPSSRSIDKRKPATQRSTGASNGIGPITSQTTLKTSAINPVSRVADSSNSTDESQRKGATPLQRIAEIKSYSKDRMRIEYVCPWCNTIGRGADSHMIYCLSCGRWSFTR